ncbi:MAG: transporter, rane protein, partial [Verrucomicrobiales bacterium]|nr:transporter, rane protein [Verrucomicrobiales bacterium]
MKSAPKNSTWLVLSFYCSLLILWQVLASARFAPDYLFPSPVQVIHRLIELAQDNLLWPSIKATLLRMVFGFLLAAAIGLVVGIAMGTSWIVNKTLKSLFLGLQMLPTAAWVPLSLLIFGLSD